MGFLSRMINLMLVELFPSHFLLVTFNNFQWNDKLFILLWERARERENFFHGIVEIKPRASTSRSDSKRTFAYSPLKSIKKGSSKNNQFRSWKRIRDEGKTREKKFIIIHTLSLIALSTEAYWSALIKTFSASSFFLSLSLLPILHFSINLSKKQPFDMKICFIYFLPEKIETFVWRWRVNCLIKSINLNQYGSKKFF